MQKVKGVDISEFNWTRKPVNFQALKNKGVKFVIIRCGFGSDDPDQDDKNWEQGVRGAEAAGLPWGAYLMSYATDLSMADSEVWHTLRLLKGRKPAYGVWLDMEADQTLGADLAAVADRFCSGMEKAGLYAGVYSSTSWFKHYLTSPVFDKYDRWVAQYYDVCELQKPYGIWQFTDAMNVDGINFDCNWAYKDYPALTRNVNKEEIDMTKDEVIKLVQDTARKTVQDELAKAEKARAQADMPKWAQAEAALSRERGIYLGDSDGNLRPMDYATKVETAVMVNRGVDAAVNIVRGLMEDRNG